MDVFDLVAKISLSTAEYEDGLKDASNKTSSFGSQLKTGLGTVAKTAGVAMVAGATAVVKFGADAVNTGKEFDQGMSQIAATLGLTTDDIKNNVDGAGDTFDSLRAKAQEMGAATNFTATEAAEGLNILAMSGYDAKSSISMIEDVLHLSAAGAMDMGSAAGYVAGAMKGFNDETKSSGYYADLMAKGATLANTSVQQLGEAISSGAAGAAAYNQSADSMAVALLRLAEQGEVGSAAGTALSAAMKNLYTPTDQAKEALNQLGIAAYDESGAARDFNTVVNELNSALSGMSDEEANAYKQTIFGIQGLNAYNKMVVTGTEKQTEWAEALAHASDGAGEASKQYDTMTDNLQGDLDILGSAMDGLKIAVSDRLTPSIREFVQFGSSGLATLTEAFQSDGLTGAADALGNIISDGVSKISSKLPELLKAGKSFVTSLVKGITQALPSIVQMLPDMLSTFIDLVFDVVDGILEQLPTIIDTLAAELPNIITTLVTKIMENLPTIITGLINVVLAIVDNLPTIIMALVDALPTIIESVITALMQCLPQIIAGLIQLTLALVMHLPEIIMALVEAIPSIVLTLVNTLVENFPAFLEAIGTLISDIWTKVKTWAEELPQKIKQWWDDLVNKIGQWFADLIGVVDENGDGIWDDIEKWFGDLIKSVVDWLKGIWNDISSWFTGLITDVANWFSDIWNDISTWFNDTITNISNFFSDIWNNISTWFNNTITDISNFFSDLWNDISTWFDGLITDVGNWAGDIIDKITGFFEDAWTLGENLVKGIWDGISGAAEWLWGKITGWLEGIWDGIKNFFGVKSPSKQMAWLGEMLDRGLEKGIEDYGDDAVAAALDVAGDVSDAMSAVNADYAFSASASPSFATTTGGMSTEYYWMVEAFKQALSEVRIELDGDEMGVFVDKTVSKLVYVNA